MQSKNALDLRKPMRTLARGEGPRLPLSDKKPRMSLRMRRRRIRAAVALLILILFGAAAWGVSYVSYLPSLSVNELEVSGTQNLPSALVRDFAETYLYNGSHHFLSRQDVFLYNPSNLAKNIEGYFPRIKSVSVSRASLLATAVEVTVVERQPYALWCTDDSKTDCYQMDDSGFIFSGAPQGASSTIAFAEPYVFEGGVATSTGSTSSTGSRQAGSPQGNPIGQHFAPSHLPGILALMQLLTENDFTPLGATIENDQDFYVPLKNGFYLKASFGEDPETLASNLNLILSSDALQGKTNQLEYVDLRFGDRIYYKLQGQDEMRASQASGSN